MIYCRNHQTGDLEVVKGNNSLVDATAKQTVLNKTSSSPQGLAWKIVKEAHDSTYYEKEALYEWLVRVKVTPGMRKVINSVMSSYVQCTRNNA